MYASNEYERDMWREALQDTIQNSGLAKLTRIIKRTGKNKGELTTLTRKQWRDLSGEQVILPNILTPDGHVRWEYSLDKLATEHGYSDCESLKEAIEQTKQMMDEVKRL